MSKRRNSLTAEHKTDDLGERAALLRAIAAMNEANCERGTTNNGHIRRVGGGANNALYLVEGKGGRRALKLYVNDDRRRARREFDALTLVHAAHLDLAPEPLWLDESRAHVPYAVVAYGWLEGERLPPTLNACQLAALLESIRLTHSLRASDFPEHKMLDAFIHWYDYDKYLNELRDFRVRYDDWLVACEANGRSLSMRLARLIDTLAEICATTDVDPHRENIPLCLCRVDANLANSVACGGRVRWVDWEYCGWGDPAFDLADLLNHASLENLTPSQFDWLRDNYVRPADDPAFEARLRIWEQLLATRWCFLILRWLWSEANGPDRARLTLPPIDANEFRERLLRYIERAERLLKPVA